MWMPALLIVFFIVFLIVFLVFKITYLKIR